MDEKPVQPSEIIADPPAAPLAGVHELLESHFRVLHARAKFAGTSSVVVLAGLTVIITAVLSILLQLLLWIVLT